MSKDGFQIRFSGVALGKFKSGVMRTLKVTKENLEEEMAEDFLKFFQTKIKSGGLELVRLRPSTISAKLRKGLPYPASPMYGKGFLVGNSYYSNIKIRKDKKGFKVGIGRGERHHSGKTMKRFAIMHSKGGDGLPARDPLKNAARLYRVKSNKAKMSQIIKKAFSNLWK